MKKEEVLTSEELLTLKNTIIKELTLKPPTVALVGCSGVGKSSTINTLFKTNLAISHTVACTKEFKESDLTLTLQEGHAKDLSTKFRVIDAPGLGEDIKKDPYYLSLYREQLPKCDIILWVMSARNRAIALDQQYLKELSSFQDKIVFGINQVDLIEPMNWIDSINLPSNEQLGNIDIIVKDRKNRLEDFLGKEIKLIAYSAKVRYNLQELFFNIVNTCPEDRAWIFNGLKNFKYDDFLPEEVKNQILKMNQKEQSKGLLSKIFKYGNNS